MTAANVRNLGWEEGMAQEDGVQDEANERNGLSNELDFFCASGPWLCEVNVDDGYGPTLACYSHSGQGLHILPATVCSAAEDIRNLIVSNDAICSSHHSRLPYLSSTLTPRRLPPPAVDLTDPQATDLLLPRATRITPSHQREVPSRPGEMHSRIVMRGETAESRRSEERRHEFPP